MSNRPADTITALSDYLWWLLPEFCKKRVDRTTSTIGGLVSSFGQILDTTRTTLEQISPQALIATATGEYMDQLARGRGVFRKTGETDASLRTRTASAFLQRQKAGTIPGVEEGLNAIGYTVTISEPYAGAASHWSRFVVTITNWTGVVADQACFFSVLNRLRPAHTRPLINSELPPGTWDDWPAGNPVEPLDEGTLDDWLEP